MSNFLVLGATGKTGRRITRRLVEAGHTVRAAARTPGEAADGITPVRFDWDDASTHDVALDGVEGVWIVPPALRLDYPPLIGDLVERAERLAVARVVFLSARGGNLDPASPLAQAEARVKASTSDWTILRPTWFLQNFTENFFRPQVESEGIVAAPAGNAKHPFIDVEDIAAVAVAALTDPSHAGREYDLSGPEAITHAQVAAELSRVTGRKIVHVSPPPEEWHQGLIEAGLPADYAGLLDTIMGFLREGHDAHLSTGVQDALGREPASCATWADRDASVLAPAG